MSITIWYLWGYTIGLALGIAILIAWDWWHQ